MEACHKYLGYIASLSIMKIIHVPFIFFHSFITLEFRDRVVKNLPSGETVTWLVSSVRLGLSRVNLH